MKKSKSFLKEILSITAISVTVFIALIFNSRETIDVINLETASQTINAESDKVQVNFRCASEKEFTTYLRRFMSNNKDLNIEKIDSSIKNEFDVTFSRGE